MRYRLINFDCYADKCPVIQNVKQDVSAFCNVQYMAISYCETYISGYYYINYKVFGRIFLFKIPI